MTLRLPASILLFAFASACTGTDKDPTDSGDGTDTADTGDTAVEVEVDADSDGHTADVDCDDANADIHPDAVEACDGVDNNCDNVVDEAGATGEARFYEDDDLDGFGNAASSVMACEAPTTYVTDATDCDDADAANFPGNPEVCDGGDNDCDTEIDEPDAVDAATWYADADRDGFGDAELTEVACAPADGWVSDATDCADGDATIFPDAPEACDGLDHDCDGATYEGSSVDVRTWFADADGDGYGDASFTSEACLAPEAYVADDTDCADDDATSYPGAAETCDDADNDCDDGVDEDVVGGPTWYADRDGDGYGDRSAPTSSCDAPRGYVADATDCDDTDSTRTTDCDGEDPPADGTFDGTFGDSWEALASTMDTPYSLQVYHPSGTLLYNMFNNPGSAYDPETNEWSRLSTSAPYSRIWNAMAPFDGQLYSIMNNSVYRYTPESDSWETLTSITGGDDYNQTESDEDGNIYGYTAAGQIVIYSAVGGGVTYVDTGLGSEYETRMGYDPTTLGLYFGGFGTPNLYRYDLESGEVREVTPHPESQLNDIFCSDRSGHIYAAGDVGGTTIWQYTTATDEWAPIPDLPSDHGNNYHCTVSEDGWLYVGAEGNLFYRLELY